MADNNSVDKRFSGPVYDIPEYSPVFYNYLQAQNLYTLEKLKEQYEAMIKINPGKYKDDKVILQAIDETIEKKSRKS